MINLKKRSNQKEQLDDLEKGGQSLHRTLDDLARINQYFGNTSALIAEILRQISKHKLAKPRIIDLGCGGGDVLRVLADTLQKTSLHAELIGIDGNAASLSYAREKSTKHSNLTFQQANILATNFQLPTCDILISSHFVYHFRDDHLVLFLQKHKAQVKYAWIFSELQRSIWAYWLFKLGSPFLALSKWTRQDGQLAIRRAFQRKELEQIFDQAQMSSVQIHWKWVFRYLIICSK